VSDSFVERGLFGPAVWLFFCWLSSESQGGERRAKAPTTPIRAPAQGAHLASVAGTRYRRAANSPRGCRQTKGGGAAASHRLDSRHHQRQPQQQQHHHHQHTSRHRGAPSPSPSTAPAPAPAPAQLQLGLSMARGGCPSLRRDRGTRADDRLRTPPQNPPEAALACADTLDPNSRARTSTPGDQFFGLFFLATSQPLPLSSKPPTLLASPLACLHKVRSVSLPSSPSPAPPPGVLLCPTLLVPSHLLPAQLPQTIFSHLSPASPLPAHHAPASH
jgi:hypothetical protein